ncbi:uncharacterized protein [Panulirus ornatus]|uniref:uncharacterized protein n=1 Tax=Panulirus ornatus TaxID=150431 RepID=UPI003A849E5B
MKSSDESDEEFVLPFANPRTKGPQLPTIKDIICTPKDYTFSALSFFVEEVGQRVMADVLKVLYSQEYILSDGGSMTVYRFCLARAKMTRHEIQAKFGETGDMLHRDVRQQEKVDVNFGYQVVAELCGSAFDCLSEGCRDRIRSLKDYKLKMVRKCCRTSRRYVREVKRLYRTVLKIYKQLGREFDKDFASSLEQIRSITGQVLEEKKKIPLEKRESPFERPSFLHEETTYPPEETTYSPEEPIYSPEETTYSPEEPIYSPEEPMYSPEEPIYSPEEPLSSPEEPMYSPEEPMYPPEEPTHVGAQNKCSSRDEKTITMVFQARQELKLHYQKLEVSNPFTWLDEAWYHTIVHYQSVKYSPKAIEHGRAYIDRVFTPLKVVDTGEVIEAKYLLETKKVVGEEEVEATALLVSGEVGSGKTALCYHLVQDWYNATRKIDGLLDFDLVLLLERCKVESQSLTEYLKKRILRATWRKYANEDILPFLKGLDLLFILDGYDEATERTFRVMQETLEHFSEKRILITTQSEYDVHPDLLALLWANHIDFQRFEVLGLDGEAQKAVAKVTYKRLFNDPDESSKRTSDFLEYYDDEWSGWTSQFIRYPVTSALYIAQREEYGEEVRTATELHDAFFRLSLNKLVERGVCDPSSSEAVLKPLLPDLLGEVAWELLKQRKRTVYDEVLDHFKETLMCLKVDHYEVLLAFLDCTFDRIKIPNGMSFSFFNVPQQAYYAARYLANRMLNYELAVHYFQREGVDWKKLYQVLVFLVGQLVAQDSNNAVLQQALGLFYDAGFPADDYTFWWNLYIEGRGHDCVGSFIAKTALPKLHWVLDADNIVPALKLLGCTPVELRTLKIDIANTVDPRTLPALLSVMQDLPFRLQDRYSAAKTIEVDLHFRQHFEEGGLYPSDEFLLALIPWATVVNFTGELGEQRPGRDLIVNPYHLRTFIARVSTPGAVFSVRDITTQLTRQCSVVRLAVGFANDYNLQSLPSLDHPYLEVHIQDLYPANSEQVIAIIMGLGSSKGVWRVYIEDCSLIPKEKAIFAVKLSGYIRDKLTIKGGDVFDDLVRRALAKCLEFTVSLLP